MALLISAASAGDQGGIGTPGVEKPLDALDATLGDQSTVGHPIAYRAELTGADLSFNFTDERQTPAPASSINFYFGGQLVVPAIGAADQSAFGASLVENAAQGASVDGIAPGRIGSTVVYAASTSSPVNLDFTDPVVSPTAQNVAFYFGGDIVVIGAGAGDQTIYGPVIESIDQPLSARPTGIAPLGFGGVFLYPAGASGAYVDFNFAEARQDCTAVSVRIDFGDTVRPVTQTGAIDSSVFGSPAIENVAQGAFVQGIDPGDVGSCFAYRKPAARGGRVDFQFLQSNTGWNPLNVPLQFIEASGFGPTGFDASEFGDTLISKNSEDVFPEGFNAAAFGSITIIYTQFIAPDGIKVDQYGAPLIKVVQVVEPYGIPPALTFGTPALHDKADLVQFIGGDVAGAGAGKISGFASGTARVELFNRTLPVTGTNMAKYGTAIVSHEIRELLAQGISAGAASTALRIEYRVRYIDQIGLDQGAFGTGTTVANYDPTQIIMLDGMAPLDVGTPKVENFTRYIEPPGRESDLLVSHFLTVENYDRAVSPYGIAPRPVGTPHVQEIVTYPIAPLGINGGAFGSATAYNLTQIVYPDSFEGTVSDYGAIYFDQTNKILPGSFDQATFGANVSVRLGQFFVSAVGVAPEGVGSVTVTHYRRHVTPPALDATQWGAAQLTSTLVYVDVDSISQSAAGTPTINFRVRHVEPNAFTSLSVGSATLGFHRDIAPAGFDASQFGSSEVHDNSRTVSAVGIPYGTFGTVTVERYVRTLGAHTVGDQSAVQPATIYNLRQYVAPFTDGPATWGPYFGNFNYIENRNRAIQAYGFNQSKVSIGGFIDNTARVLRAPSIADSSADGASLVAYRIRYLGLDGIEPGGLTRWHVVYNDARVLAPVGTATDSFGTTVAANLNRTVGQFFPYAGPEMGTAFVADAIRTISFYQGIPEGNVGGQTVFNSVQYLPVPTITKGDETGAHAVYEHFTIIAPRFNFQERTGFPTVRNLTPELGAFGYEQTLFGQTAIRTQYRFVSAEGSRTELFGAHVIKDRTQRSSVFGFKAWAIDRYTRVELDNPYLPYTRTIAAVGFSDIINGADQGIGDHTVRSNVLFAQGIEPKQMPNGHTVDLYGIAVPSIPLDLATQFGFPAFNQTQYAAPQGINAASFSRQRLDPHTIWATFFAPAQARDNHDGNDWHFMDYTGSNDGGARPFFGAPAVTNQHRRIYADDIPSHLNTGIASVSNRRRWINVTGLYSWKYGVPEIGGGDRGLTAYGYEMGGYGAPVLTIPEPLNRTLTAQGTAFAIAGTTTVQNFNRSLLLSGFDAGYVQRPPLVSRAPRYLEPAGPAAGSWGTAYVDFKIRHLYTIGEDAAEVSFSPGSFSDRLRVHGRKGYAIGGIDFAAIGAPSIAQHHREIGLAGGKSHGGTGVPACSARNIVALGGLGIDAEVFGDVDRWEAGKLKPYGDDTSRYGAARLDRIITVVGIHGDAGDPRMAWRLAPSAFDTAEFGSPATPLVNPHGCGSTARAVVPFDVQGNGVGAPSVQ